MGEHAGKGACGASMQGGLYRGPLGRTLLRREDTSLPVVAARIQPTTRATLCTPHARLRVRHGGVVLPATRTRWWPPRAHTARRVLCTLGATTH